MSARATSAACASEITHPFAGADKRVRLIERNLAGRSAAEFLSRARVLFDGLLKSLPMKGFMTIARTPRRITISRSRSSAEHDSTITGSLGFVQRMWVSSGRGSRFVCNANQQEIRVFPARGDPARLLFRKKAERILVSERHPQVVQNRQIGLQNQNLWPGL